MTNDNSTPQIENPASDNKSDGNGKGGDITAVVETADKFTINRFSEEPQQTPLEELIEEYNATIDAAKKLEHVADEILSNSIYSTGTGLKVMIKKITRYYWKKLLDNNFFDKNSVSEILQTYQDTIDELSSIEFNSANI